MGEFKPGEANIEKTYEPSHIRRGRASVNPTWWVVLSDGARWRFMRKLDAQRFINLGGCPAHDEKAWRCESCFGWRERRRALTAADDGGEEQR